MERIKFFSIADMSTGVNLLNVKENIEQFDENKKEYGINEIIEFYNVTKYIDTESYKNYKLGWSDDEILKIKETTKKYKKIIACYIKKISDKNIIENYMQIKDEYYDYGEDFFELIEKYKVYENISEPIFNKLLHSQKVFLEYILKNKKITHYYGKVIRQRFLEESEYAEIILDYYEAKHTGSDKTFYFPKELTIKDKEEIIINYINSQNPNLNYLKLINNIQNTNNVLIRKIVDI